jgi:membrane-bound lytic murein transglycosylase D
MSTNRERKALMVGIALATVSSLTAVAVSHPDAVEPVPMEAVLEAHSAVEASAWDLPVTRNERVEKWIRFLSNGNSDNTRLWLERSGRYEPMIRAQLRDRGMPEDLVYLAFIESGFSPRAYSRAAASGIWQFIEETGERYGLEVNSYIDERRDPFDATRAALDYLQELYNHFGSWYLAAAAYNSGENRVDRILRQRAGGRKGSDELFWRIAQYLPEETRNYVPLMLAAGHISKNPAQYGFKDVAYHTPIEFDTAWVTTQTSLELIARAAGVDKEAVRELNPHLVRGVTPPGRAYAVRIPPDTRFTFAQNFPALCRQELEAEKTRVAMAKLEGRRHTIRRGETLTKIASRYDVSVSSLLSANNGISARQLRPGKVLTIPRTGGKTTVASAAPTSTKTKVASAATTVSKTKVASSARSSSARRVHRVRSGENLSTIAERYDTNVKRLQSMNGLGRRSRIYPGQKLRVG